MNVAEDGGRSPFFFLLLLFADELERRLRKRPEIVTCGLCSCFDVKLKCDTATRDTERQKTKKLFSSPTTSHCRGSCGHLLVGFLQPPADDDK